MKITLKGTKFSMEEPSANGMLVVGHFARWDQLKYTSNELIVLL